MSRHQLLLMEVSECCVEQSFTGPRWVSRCMSSAGGAAGRRPSMNTRTHVKRRAFTSPGFTKSSATEDHGERRHCQRTEADRGALHPQREVPLQPGLPDHTGDLAGLD